MLLDVGDVVAVEGVEAVGVVDHVGGVVAVVDVGAKNKNREQHCL